MNKHNSLTVISVFTAIVIFLYVMTSGMKEDIRKADIMEQEHAIELGGLTLASTITAQSLFDEATRLGLLDDNAYNADTLLTEKSNSYHKQYSVDDGTHRLRLDKDNTALIVRFEQVQGDFVLVAAEQRYTFNNAELCELSAAKIGMAMTKAWSKTTYQPADLASLDFDSESFAFDAYKGTYEWSGRCKEHSEIQIGVSLQEEVIATLLEKNIPELESTVLNNALPVPQSTSTVLNNALPVHKK